MAALPDWKFASSTPSFQKKKGGRGVAKVHETERGGGDGWRAVPQCGWLARYMIIYQNIAPIPRNEKKAEFFLCKE